MSVTPSRVKFGQVGLGGYANAVRTRLEQATNDPNGKVSLTAVYEPDTVTHGETIEALRQQGVTICDSYEQLLEQDIEVVWLPLPIDLHRPFTVQACEAGKHVVCEKPAAGSIDDVDAMIAARDKARVLVCIGYQSVYEPTTLAMKRELLAGKIGNVKHAVVQACWPRLQAYFDRAAWAGRMARRGTWVLDSPANNAMAHYVNLPLFLLGPDEAHSAVPVGIEAELYRAYDIQNYDTCALRITLDTGATLTVLYTHACQERSGPIIDITGDNGTARWAGGSDCTVSPADAEVINIPPATNDRSHIPNTVADKLRGVPNNDSAIATLEVARSHTLAINGASEASEIHPVSSDQVRRYKDGESHGLVIEGIEDLVKHCVETNQLFHESGKAPWTKPAGSFDLKGYNHFNGPKGFDARQLLSAEA